MNGECVSCGAPMQPHESACSYCGRVVEAEKSDAVPGKLKFVVEQCYRIGCTDIRKIYFSEEPT